MSFDPFEDTLQACAAIEAMLEDATPWPNPDKVARIRFQCAQMRGNEYIREYAGKVANYAEQYFSSRKHTKFNGGAPALLEHMRYRCLSAIRDEVQRLSNGAQTP
jgi:hypothetical protein